MACIAIAWASGVNNLQKLADKSHQKSVKIVIFTLLDSHQTNA